MWDSIACCRAQVPIPLIVKELIDMYHKIGVLAKRFGITTQALRFYEQHGLLDADRSMTGGARRYNTRNFKWLYSIRRYHDLGFSMEDILKLFACTNTEILKEFMDARRIATQDEILVLQQRMIALERQMADLDRVHCLLHVNELEYRPELWLLVNQNDQQVDLSPGLEKNVQEWMRFLPFVYASSIIPREFFDFPNKTLFHQSGFCVERSIAAEIGLKPGDYARSLEICRAVHTVIKLDGQTPTIQHLFGRTIEFMEERNLAISGPAVGRCLAKAGEIKCQDTLRPESVYYEFWIPVTE
jgi:Predicted transcriptional regulators